MNRHFLAHNGGDEVVDHTLEQIENGCGKIALFHTVPLIASVKAFVAVDRVVQTDPSVVLSALFQKFEILRENFG